MDSPQLIAFTNSEDVLLRALLRRLDLPLVQLTYHDQNNKFGRRGTYWGMGWGGVGWIQVLAVHSIGCALLLLG